MASGQYMVALHTTCRVAPKHCIDAHNTTISAVYTWHYFKAAPDEAAALASHVSSNWQNQKRV